MDMLILSSLLLLFSLGGVYVLSDGEDDVICNDDMFSLVLVSFVGVEVRDDTLVPCLCNIALLQH